MGERKRSEQEVGDERSVEGGRAFMTQWIEGGLHDYMDQGGSS